MDLVFANSECSSGCDSGWTLYLDNSCIAPYGTYKGNDFADEKRVKEEEEEDLSMVSDASSGPPHFHEDDYYIHNNNNNGCKFREPIQVALPKKSGKREKGKESSRRKIQEQPSLLDDTASSPIFDFSNNNFALINNHQASVPNMLDFSQGYSTTHFQGRSAYQERYACFQSSLSGNQLQQNQWYEEQRWGDETK